MKVTIHCLIKLIQTFIINVDQLIYSQLSCYSYHTADKFHVRQHRQKHR